VILQLQAGPRWRIPCHQLSPRLAGIAWQARRFDGWKNSVSTDCCFIM